MAVLSTVRAYSRVRRWSLELLDHLRWMIRLSQPWAADQELPCQVNRLQTIETGSIKYIKDTYGSGPYGSDLKRRVLTRL